MELYVLGETKKIDISFVLFQELMNWFISSSGIQCN